ncbi:MAG: hypothetical protein FWC13_05300 [Oscillospiraceae bacterium]|nr:hypothetical protein [Oscillospiraceae bacterium]
MPARKILTRADKIKKEKARLTKIFKGNEKEPGIDENKLNTVKTLIDNAAFMTVTLEELQEQINESGVSEDYKNGANQWGRKQTPEVEVYISMTRNMTTIIKELANLAPQKMKKNNEIIELMRAKNA